MLTELQKRTCQALVNIFETGRALGVYGAVTYHPNDPGQLTYGRSQTTLASGNLALLLTAYCKAPDAQYADALRPYLPRLVERSPELNSDRTLRDLLKAAGDDPVMHDVQDGFFDRVYWTPAATAAAALGLSTALGMATVYDSTVHGSWGRIRDLTNAAVGLLAACGEQAWVRGYIGTRRGWLAASSNTLLQKTVYRMDALQALADAGVWDLRLPLTVRGVRLDEALLLGTPPVRVSAQLTEERTLRLKMPYLQGDDVRAVQTALSRNGFGGVADGIFGPATDRAVKDFQQSRKLVADGVVGAATRSALGL